MAKNIEIREMRISDFSDVYKVWESSQPGVRVGPSDTRENIEKYLKRNPGLSQVAMVDSKLVGAVLCGHDGRIGIIHRLAVYNEYRRMGVGKALIEKCQSGLLGSGISRCMILIFRENADGVAFWNEMGWQDRDYLSIMFKKLDSE